MRRLLPVLAVLLAGCGSVSVSQPPTATPPPPPGASSASTGTLTQVHDPGQVTGHLTGPCHTRDGGQLPDPACTPGSIDPAITAAVLCAPGYTTDSYRPPSSQTTRAKLTVVEPAYGMTGAVGELDHEVPLELGGSNDLSNLWVEAGKIPNAKDSVEGALHRAVCAGKVSLGAAQAAIARNWTDALQTLGLGA